MRHWNHKKTSRRQIDKRLKFTDFSRLIGAHAGSCSCFATVWSSVAPKSQDFPLVSATSEASNPYEHQSGTERRDRRVKKIERTQS